MRTILVGLALLTLTSCAPAQTRTVQVGERVYTVEVATTEDDQRQGLAGRPEVDPGTGMLFLASRSTQQVWGAGMLVAVDVVWIAGDEVAAVDVLEPCTARDQSTCPRLTSPVPVDAVLEVPAGSGIITGETVTLRDQSTPKGNR